MSPYSKVQVFCNNCGKDMMMEYYKMMGKTFKVCSSDCLKQMQLKEACSLMGQEYPPKKKDDTQEKDPTWEFDRNRTTEKHFVQYPYYLIIIVKNYFYLREIRISMDPRTHQVSPTSPKRKEKSLCEITKKFLSIVI